MAAQNSAHLALVSAMATVVGLLVVGPAAAALAAVGTLTVLISYGISNRDNADLAMSLWGTVVNVLPLLREGTKVIPGLGAFIDGILSAYNYWTLHYDLFVAHFDKGYEYADLRRESARMIITINKA